MDNQESYRHFYLYAKGWYKKTDLMLDLKKLTAQHCRLLPEHVAERDVFLVLAYAVAPYIDFSKFMNDFMDKQYFFNSDKTELNLMSTMLLTLMRLKSSEINFNLGDPDPNILELVNYPAVSQ